MIIKDRLILIACIAAFIPMLVSYTPPQESRVNQKKIEREHAKKEKEAKRQYDKAVKRHQSMQTKETKSRMKKTKKDSKKSTPIQR